MQSTVVATSSTSVDNMKPSLSLEDLSDKHSMSSSAYLLSAYLLTLLNIDMQLIFIHMHELSSVTLMSSYCIAAPTQAVSKSHLRSL